jgi:hypothetical protein
VLSDIEIAALIAEAKSLPEDWREQLGKFKQKHVHRESSIDIQGEHGSRFRLVIRRSDINAKNFSVALLYAAPELGREFRLRRYNGNHHQHTNRIEGTQINFDFHVHEATYRYQELGADEDAYARPTDEFHDTDSALKCLFAECNFSVPRPDELELFC